MSELANRPECPRLTELVLRIGSASAFQRKALTRFLDDADSRYFIFAEEFIERMSLVIAPQIEPLRELASLYLKYTNKIKTQEVFFAKEHRYQATRFSDVYNQLYSHDDSMREYLIGLAMTQILWPNHWAIVRFFLDKFLPEVKEARVGVEVGPGHGLFHAELLQAVPYLHSTIVDVSPVSLDMTRRMLLASNVRCPNAQGRLVRTFFVQRDIQGPQMFLSRSVDVLLLGEIIEHLDRPYQVMAGLRESLRQDGLCFFTTAANAPAEDHILLFRSVREIHQFLTGSGWAVLEEQVTPIGNLTVAEAERDGRNINYAAILAPQHSEGTSCRKSESVAFASLPTPSE